MKAKNLTIRDVANRAGVSVGTASRVINGAPNVDESYRKLVLAAVDELGFVPSRAAQSIRRGSSGEIGVIVRDITVPVLAGFVRAAQSVVEAAGYVLLISNGENLKARELELMAQFQRRRIEGLIMTTGSETDLELVKARDTARFPVVLMDREGADFDRVLVDHAEGVRQAVSYLLSLGHVRILLVTGDVATYPARSRATGYKAAFAAAGMVVDPALIRTVSFEADFAFTESAAWLTSAQPPTAIVAGGIDMLPGVMKAARSCGADIPGDVSIVGAGDSDLAILATPSISVVRWDYAELGRAAARMILERLVAESPIAPRRILFQPELVIRASCAAPASRIMNDGDRKRGGSSAGLTRR